MRYAAGWVAVMVITGGCGGPQIPPQELGEVVFKVPEVPGADKPYPLPELPPGGARDASSKPLE